MLKNYVFSESLDELKFNYGQGIMRKLNIQEILNSSDVLKTPELDILAVT